VPPHQLLEGLTADSHISEAAVVYFSQNGTYLGPKAGTTSFPGSNVGFNENATLPFEPGKTYRLRLINTSALAAFFFWIDGHEMRVIEVDGVCPVSLYDWNHCLFIPLD